MRLCLSILLSTAAFAQQTDWISQIRNKPFPDTRTYIWSQNVSGSISIGSNTKTLTPCPLGLNGTDTGHYIYISGGTGTAEAVLITGGTCTSGANNGTVTFTAAHTHSGSYTLATASTGLQEAICALPSTGGNVASIGAVTLRANVGACGKTGVSVTREGGTAISGAFTILLYDATPAPYASFRTYSPNWTNSSSFSGFTVPVGDTGPVPLFQQMQNCSGCQANDGFDSVINVPSTATQWEAAGIFGAVSNKSVTTNGVGARMYCRSIADGTGSADGQRVRCWGFNTLQEDQTYNTGSTGPYNATVFNHTYLLNEMDFNVGGPDTKVIGISFGGNSTAQPASAIAILCNTLGSGITWDACVSSSEGAASIFAQIAAQGPTTATSQVLNFFSKNASVAKSGSFFLDTNGAFTLVPNNSTGGVNLQDGLGNTALAVTAQKVAVNTPLVFQGVAFASLPAAASYTYGTVRCVNCTAGSSPCTSGASSVFATSNGSSWSCGTF